MVWQRRSLTTSRGSRGTVDPALDKVRELMSAKERHRVDVDVRRTDRTQPLFALPSDAPNENAAQAASNEHVDRLGTILLNYNFYEKELGMLDPYIRCV